MSNFAAQQGRSVEGRAVLCAVILLNSMVVTISLINAVGKPGFILTTREGQRIRARHLELSKLALNNEDNGFDVQTPGRVIRIGSDLRGVRKLEIVSQDKATNLETENQFSRILGDEFKVKIRIETYFGEVIEGVSDLKPEFERTRDSLFLRVTAHTNTGAIEVNTQDIKSIERESSRLYDWGIRLF